MTRTGCRNSLVSAVLLAALPAHGSELTPEFWELTGELELEGTGFFEPPQFPEQDSNSISVAGEATLLAEWLDGDLIFRLTPFARADSADDRRTHFDIREAKFDYVVDDWSFTFGADTVFWGKTEVVHLVDIINQTDQVEDIDDEDRLGQPMLRAAYLSDFGEFSAFVLPFFRERTFPGADGRLRFAVPVNTALPIFETDAEEWTTSFALRYSAVFGDVDLGLSAFHGLSRDPSFFFDGEILQPVYSRITQVGVDLQYTTDATLWKFESILREGQRDATGGVNNFWSATGGFEHTFFGVFETNADVGLIGEYAFDDRSDVALTAFQNDAIAGARLTLNDPQDTAVLLTSAIDIDDGAVSLRLEAERRIGSAFKVEIEAVGLLNQNDSSFAGAFADDSFVRAKLRWFF